MALTRRAILISNPGEVGEENYCKGVYVDIANYKAHLLSEVGGWWSVSEITHLDRPTASDVRAAVKSASAHDYVMVAFSGHGWYSSLDKDRILQLKKGVNFLSQELSVGLKKCTIILDCCQKVYHESALEQRTVVANAQFKSASFRRTPNGQKCRDYFFEQIGAIGSSEVRMISCSKDEFAEDSDERGGRYTGSIFECIDDWTNAQSINFSVSNSAYSVVAAHECAAARTVKLSKSRQNPVIEKPRTGPYFPLAVFA